jgi:hypothetical protein
MKPVADTQTDSGESNGRNAEHQNLDSNCLHDASPVVETPSAGSMKRCPPKAMSRR